MFNEILGSPSALLTEPASIFLTLMAVILITPILSERARLPGIVGLIVGGILVGPNGFNLLPTGKTIELLSTVGLIYLMFSAGLEIDLNQFNQVRNKSMLFGAFTFIIPEISGIALGRLIGLDWGGAILLGSVYAVPIANPQNHVNLITLAGILARWGKGALYPVNIAQEVQGRVEGREHQRQLLDDPILKDPQTDIRPIGRVDTSVPKGILRTAIENDASLIVMGWHGQASFMREAVFGSVQDEVMWSAKVPVVVGRLTTPINAVERVVLVVPHHSVEPVSVRRTLHGLLARIRDLNLTLISVSRVDEAG